MYKYNVQSYNYLLCIGERFHKNTSVQPKDKILFHSSIHLYQVYIHTIYSCVLFLGMESFLTINNTEAMYHMLIPCGHAGCGGRTALPDTPPTWGLSTRLS